MKVNKGTVTTIKLNEDEIMDTQELLKLNNTIIGIYRRGLKACFADLNPREVDNG